MEASLRSDFLSDMRITGKAVFRYGLGLIVLGVALAYAYHWIRYEEWKVSALNMAPTLVPGSSILVDKWYSADMKRGAIIAFYAPLRQTAEAKIYVGRIVGLPGEHVTIRNGSACVNDIKLSGIFQAIHYEPAGSITGSSVAVGQGHFFILGDNSNQSFDSRYWGPLPRTNIIGEVASVDYDGARFE